MKILNNVIITKCGECKIPENCNYEYCPFLEEIDENFKSIRKPLKMETIDADCLLQDCEVVDNFWADNKTGQEQFIMMDCGCYANEIDHIIIIKKRGIK